jgi:RNA polymerase sigma-70 factor (ECF subfamily)
MATDPSQEDPERAASRAQVRAMIEAGIDRLPETFRSVFVLRGVEELTVEETATALGIPPATVRSRFFRARALLREALAREIDSGIDNAFSFAGERCDRIVAGVLARLPPP